jgi:hypothetical protein
MKHRRGKVAVLGSTPSGLLAAHALDLRGVPFDLYSEEKEPHVPQGCQYLHESIPLLTPEAPEAEISYQLYGTPDGYRAKVYGPGSLVEVSPESLVGTHPAWDIRKAYNLLWKRYAGRVKGMVVNADHVLQLVTSGDYRLIISTVPAHRICRMVGHEFKTERIWVVMRNVAVLSPNTVICNGEDSPSWYRCSLVMGVGMTEWPFGSKPIYGPPLPVLKPLSNNCSCWENLTSLGGRHPTPVVAKLGRRGSWTKGVLATDVFKEAQKWADRFADGQL